MGWALQDVATVTLHGRALEAIIRYLQPGARILALSWDGETPHKLATLLAGRGLGASRLIVLESMGGPRERVRDGLCNEAFAAALYAQQEHTFGLWESVGARILSKSAFAFLEPVFEEFHATYGCNGVGNFAIFEDTGLANDLPFFIEDNLDVFAAEDAVVDYCLGVSILCFIVGEAHGRLDDFVLFFVVQIDAVARVVFDDFRG